MQHDKVNLKVIKMGTKVFWSRFNFLRCIDKPINPLNKKRSEKSTNHHSLKLRYVPWGIIEKCLCFHSTEHYLLSHQNTCLQWTLLFQKKCVIIMDIYMFSSIDIKSYRKLIVSIFFSQVDIGKQTNYCMLCFCFCFSSHWQYRKSMGK